MEEVTAGAENLRNGELYYLLCLAGVIRMSKTKVIRREGRVACKW
jgi:hypothetical protein